MQVCEASRKHKEWGQILSDYFARPIAWLLIKFTHVTPNQVSIFSFLLGLVGAYFLYLGGFKNVLIGASFAFAYNVLDMCDGIIARVKNLRSPLGHWLDGTFGFILSPLLLLSLAVGLHNYTALIVGMAAVVSYPLQYSLVYFYKLEILKSTENTKIPGKFEFLRYAYGNAFLYVFLLVAALLNQPWAVLWFWAILGNLYWVALLVVQYFSVRKQQE